MTERPRPNHRRTVNIRAVVVLLIGAVGLGGAGYLVRGFQVRRNADALSEQARQAREEGQPALAADYLAQYLALVPADTEALADYALLLKELAGNRRERLRAYSLMEAVLRRQGDRSDVRRQAARLALGEGLWSDARFHLEQLRGEDPKDAGLLRLLGRCELGQKDYTKAAAFYAEALRHQPRQIDWWDEHVTLLRDGAQDTAGASEAVTAMLGANQSSVPARLVAARHFLRAGSPQDAAQHFAQALEGLSAPEPEVLVQAADVASSLGRRAAAREHLEQGVKLHPRDGRLRRALTRLELQEGRPARAREVLAGIADLPAGPLELWDLGNLLASLGETGRAEKVIERLRAGAVAWAVDFLQARLAMQKEEWGRARLTLEGLRRQSLNLPEVTRQIHLLLAECYGRLSNPDQQLLAARAALAADPTSVPARLLLAEALVSLGKTDQASAEHRRVAERSFAARLALGRLEQANSLRALREEGNWREVERALKATPEERQKTAEVQLLWAEVRVAQGKPEEARKLAEAARDRDPREVAPWLFLAELARQQGRTDQVLPLLDEAQRRAGPLVDWQMARARHWARVGGAEGKLQLGRLAEGLPRLSQADRDRLLQPLAGALALVDDLPGAERLWRQVARRRPRDLAVRLLRVELAFRAGKEAEVRSLLAEIERVEGEGGPVAAYVQAALGLLRARRGNRSALEEARQRLARASELRPSWSRVPALEGELEELDGRPDRALVKYLAAIQGGEVQLAVVSRAVRLLLEQRRYREADALLRRLPPQALGLGGLEGLAAQAALLSPGGQDERDTAAARRRAIELARRAAPDNSKDFRAHLWRGQVEMVAGRNEQAERSLRRARDLAGAAPDPWVALVLFLARTDPKKAETELAAARTKLGKEDLPLVLAAGYEALGRTGEAEEQYQALVTARTDDPVALLNIASFYARIGPVSRAEPWLRKLIDPGTRTAETTVGWARRTLALLLASSGSYRGFREAQALLDQNDKHGGTVEDRQTRALVLATQPASRRQAMRLFEELSGPRASPPPEVRYVLSQLYEAEGNWPRARVQLLALLREQDRNPFYLARYIRALLRHKEADEAEEWLDRLEKVVRPAFTTVELRARILHARGKADAAAKLLGDYAAWKDARLDLTAALLDDLGRASDAEKLYRSHAAVSQDPRSALLIANHLVRHGRSTEALALCAKAWDRCPPEAVVAALAALVRSPKATEAQWLQAERQLTAAIRKHPEAIALPVLLGEVQDRLGRQAEAIGVYRAVLRQAPRQVVALNNLAFLLAVKEGRHAEALNLIQAAIEEVGPYPELLDTRAMVHLTGSRADLAVRDLHQAIAQATAPAKYHFHLAQAHNLAGDEREAREAYRKAVAFGVKEPDLHPLERPAWRRLARGFAGK
jgi:tetratricopeptide (TPR) repeat protein